MPANQFPAPARRADAERNRGKILAAARTAFADPDAEVSMAEISRRAGVGMATLYRNFPGRQELLEALYTDEVNAICQAAETTGGETPGATLVAWLHRFFAFTTSKRHIASELLKHTDHTNPLFQNNRTRVIAAGRPLPRQVRQTHAIGMPEECAPLVVFLASDAAAGVTGQCIGLGGDKLALWSHPKEVSVAYSNGRWTPEEIAVAWQTAVGLQPETYGIGFLTKQ